MTKLTIVIVVFAAIAVAESAFGEKSVKYSRSGPMKTTFNNRKRDNSYLSPFVADHPEVQHHSEDYHHTPAVTYSDATPAVYETHHHSDDYISSHKPTIYSSAPAAVYDDGHHHTPSAVVDAHHDDYHYKTAAHSAAPTVYEAQHQHHSDDYSHSKPATYAHDEKTYSSTHRSSNPYSFSYAVKDDYYNNDYGHEQKSDEMGHVTGSYHVLLPDGRTQIVTYVADSYGYRADVKYEGVAKPYEYTKPAAAYKAAPSVDYHHAINHQEDALYETPVAVNRKRSVIPKPKQINSIKKY